MLLKVNVKKWEYKVYGGRPEFYPQDRKALLTLLEFQHERIEYEKRRMEKQEEMKQRRANMRGG